MKSWDDIRPDLLTFPIGGKVYTIPELPYDAMLTIQRAKAGESTYLDGMTAEETWRLVMGGAWDEMVTDNVPAEAIARAGFATLAYFELGQDAAEAVWENGIDPKALAEGDDVADIATRAEQYGRGERDPLTGAFEWYEFPPEFVEEVEGGHEGFTVLDLVARWDLVVADFASEYGIRLGRGERPSWREFRSLLVGLMASDTRLSRHFSALEPEDDA